jgi:hypothetical protein
MNFNIPDEVPWVYRWEDMQIERPVLEKQLHELKDHSQQAMNGWRNRDRIFWLRDRSTGQIVSLVILEKRLSVFQNGRHIDVNEWVTWHASVPDMQWNEGLPEPIVARWSTFLFDHLGLDPQYTNASVRNRLRVPYITKIPIQRLPRHDWEPTPLWVIRDTYGMREWLDGVGGLLGLDQRVRESTRDQWNMGNDFCEITVVVSKPTDGGDEAPVPTSVWWGHAKTEFLPTLGEALEASGAFTTEEGLDAWLDAHHVAGGESRWDPEFYELLDLEFPTLMDRMDLIEILEKM